MNRATDTFRAVLPLREAARVQNDWLRRRLETVLPEVMRREGIDTWIVVAREYAEDPVVLSLLPAPMLSARRRTVLVFHAPEDGPFEALAIANAGIGLDETYDPVWRKTQTERAEETQAEALRRILEARTVTRIGIDVSETFAFGDGLTVTQHAWLEEALGPDLFARTVSAERVAVGWLERRLPEEIASADASNRLAHDLIAEAFSARVIQPGVTRATDVAWWLRERTRELGLSCWFHPSVSIQRRGTTLSPMGATPDAVILPGDLLHCDFGLHELGLATDTQRNAYVPHLHEDGPSDGMREAMRLANRQQDLLAAEMVAGRTGNEVLAAARAAMDAEGLDGRIYSHPIGVHGHGAGPMIGRYDEQQFLPGTGEAILHDDTLFSFEMLIRHPLPEWDGQTIYLATEQIVAFTGGAVRYLGGGRQTHFHLVR